MEPIDMFQAMGAIIFTSDIEDIVRLGVTDSKTDRPAPVKVTFVQFHIRDKVMKRKAGLATKDKYATIYINAEEPADVRRINVFFRRITYKASIQGKEVPFRRNWIQIDVVTSTSSELDRIPAEYNPDPVRPKKRVEPKDTAPVISPVDDKPQDQETRNVLITDLYNDPGVKLKLTPCGLTFSGPTAFCSNMNECDFVFNDQPYSSTAQSFQHLHAVHENVFDLAEKILGTRNTKKIKEMSHDIPTSDSWNRITPGKLWSLNDAKYSQNPTLIDKLIATAPHRLVEASVDGTYRDQKVAQRELKDNAS